MTYDHNQKEQRRFSRIPFDAKVNIIGPVSAWESRLLDISLKGALVELPQGWNVAVGDPCRLEVKLGGSVTISMDTNVAHVERNHIGFRCHHIDLESVTHLRRVVELNMGDPSLLDRELSSLISGH